MGHGKGKDVGKEEGTTPKQRVLGLFMLSSSK